MGGKLPIYKYIKIYIYFNFFVFASILDYSQGMENCLEFILII